MDIGTQFDKDICWGYCRQGCRGKRNGVLEHGFIKYLIGEIEVWENKLKQKVKSLIICLR